MSVSMETVNKLEAVSCPGCGQVVGEVIPIAGAEMLLVNGILVRSLHGVCLKCGCDFHWSLSDRLLVNLLKDLRSKLS